MRYSEHFENQELSFNDVAKVWRGILIQTVVFIALFVFLGQINYFTKTYPEYGIYTFYIGLVSILPSLFVLLRYFSLKRFIRRSFRRIDRRFVLLGEDAKKLQKCLTAGFILADITLLIGVAHLVITGNLVETAYLWASALLLCVLYKPCVRYINCGSTAKSKAASAAAKNQATKNQATKNQTTPKTVRPQSLPVRRPVAVRQPAGNSRTAPKRGRRLEAEAG